MNRNYDHIKDYIEANIDMEMRLLISDFAILWGNYEQYAFRTNYRYMKVERNIINKIDFFDEYVIKFINDMYQRLLKYFEYRNIEMNINFVKSHYYIRINDITDDDLKILIESDKIEDKLRFLLLIIGRIRNNMFHGIKKIFQISEQKELFKISNETLTFILKITNKLVI